MKTKVLVESHLKDLLKTKASEIESELSMSQQEILNTIDIWVSEGSGWTIDKIDSNYINIAAYQPLHGFSYIDLPEELKNSAKGLINIKNRDDQCFRWCHIRHFNPQKKDPLRIKKAEKQYLEKLDYTNIVLPVSQKQYNKIEKQNSIRINVFGYENKQPYPIHVSKETSEDQINLLLITEDEKKHYVLIKDFDKFMYNQSRHKERTLLHVLSAMFFIRKHLREACQQLFNNQWSTSYKYAKRG